MEPWHLPGDPLKALLQVRTANQLLQAALLLALDALRYGIRAIVEHPDYLDLHKVKKAASIWKLLEMIMTLMHRNACLVHVDQGFLGAISLKPTAFLCVHVVELEML